MRKHLTGILVVVFFSAFLSLPARTAAHSGQGESPTVGGPVVPGRSPRVSDLPADALPVAPASDLRGESADLLFDFEGVGPDAGDPAAPADPAGDVGPAHYVQMVNRRFAVYNKTGGLIAGPVRFSDLYTGFGGICENEVDGNGTVLYDPLANRWLLGMSAGFSADEYTMCFAVSTTANPAGAYHLYAFDFSLPVNYPKVGVWTDAYYMGMNSGFVGSYPVVAFDRENMLAGNPATYQDFEGHPNFLMPADLDGPIAPPANSPGVFYTFLKSGYPNHPPGVDRIVVYEFDVDWATPANTTFASVDVIPIAAFNYTVCGFTTEECIDQPGTTMQLSSLSNWPMWRLAYRNLGTDETLLGNFTYDFNNSDRAAIRWFELRNSPSGWELFQQGTHAPDTDHRWLGSMAMDGSGNIAIGYSVSSGVTKPSLRFATRLVTDPPGTLQPEQSLIAGTGIQTGFPTFGSFSSMSVDPADECTFWFTGAYHAEDSNGFGWNTRVGVFKIPSCSGGFEPDFTIDVSPETLAICAPTDANYTVTIGSILGYDDPVALSQQGAPGGTNASFSVNPVIPPGVSTLSIEDTGAAAAGHYVIDVTGTGSSTTYSSTVELDLFLPVAGPPVLISPPNGATGVSVKPTLTWSAVSQADTYSLQVSLNAGFTNLVYTADGVTATSHPVGVYLSETTTYFWRVRGVNACGNGAYSAGFSFTTEALPPILLVDDDDDDPDVRPAWTAALDALGEDFDVWQTGEADAEPAADALANYETVLWLSGDRFGAGESGPAGPGPLSETALAAWLDGGGCFFISSQDYHADKGTTAFMTNYLGISEVVDDEGNYTSVTGQNLLAGLGPYSLTFLYEDYTDDLTAGNGGQTAMQGDNANHAGVSKSTGAYKTWFWAFGLEILPVAGRTATLGAFLDWCTGTLPAAFTKTAPANGATGVSIDPTLSWAASAGGVTYEYCIDTTNDNACSGWVNVGGATNVALAGLSPGTAYFWQVRAVNLAGTTYANGAAAAHWSFTTIETPAQFTIYLPIVKRGD